METLLSLTSRKAGEWFKEELRNLCKYSRSRVDPACVGEINSVNVNAYVLLRIVNDETMFTLNVIVVTGLINYLLF